MTGFKKFYLWGMNTKLYMGIYFAAIVFVCGLILALNGQTSLSLLVLLEMFILSFAVTILQSVLVPDTTDFSGGIFAARAMLWALASALMTFAASACLGWLDPLGLAADMALGALMLAGFLCMLIGQRFEQERDTERLNAALARHQKSGSR